MTREPQKAKRSSAEEPHEKAGGGTERQVDEAAKKGRVTGAW